MVAKIINQYGKAGMLACRCCYGVLFCGKPSSTETESEQQGIQHSVFPICFHFRPPKNPLTTYISIPFNP
jgi:hypothetical protein